MMAGREKWSFLYIERKTVPISSSAGVHMSVLMVQALSPHLLHMESTSNRSCGGFI